MYWKHLGLAEDPFSLTADRRFLFLTDAHRDVLAALRESMETERGFAAMIGSPGVGKTTLLCELIEQLRESTVPVFLVQAHVELIDILQLLLKELGQEPPKVDAASLHQCFAETLKQVAGMGKRLLLVIDEVQALNPTVLETIRLLSNIELGRKKIVEAVFAGQNDFEELLARPNLQVLKQRIAAYGRLKPFTPEETREYVTHRVRIAGGAEVFTPEALEVLADLSHGVARTINIYGFQALHAAVKKGVKSADSDVTRKAIYEFEGWPLPASAPVLAPRLEPAPEAKAACVRDEEDDYFESGKDAGLQALLASLRSDRSSEREEAIPGPPVMPAITPMPAAAPAVAKSEPIPFSIAAVLKSAESMPSVHRTAAAVAPAYEPVALVDAEKKVPEAQTAVAPEPVKTMAKAPVLVVSAPLAKTAPVEPKSELIPTQPPRATKTALAPARMPLWQKKQAQLVFAIAIGMILLMGAAAFAYKRGSFGAASAAGSMETRQAAAPAPPRVVTSVSANPPATNFPTETVKPPVTRSQVTAETPQKRAPNKPAATEIATGTAPRLNEADPAPAAPVSLGSIAQPNLGAALATTAQPVALVRRTEEVKPAVVISQTKPTYPEMAARQGLAGLVVLRVQVNAQGKPTKVDVISGHPVLAAAAKSAVASGWRFSPATLGGKPVESESEVRVNFRGNR